MSGYNRQGNHRIKHTNVGSPTERKPKAKIDGSLDSSSCSQNDKSSVTGESVVKDAASVLKDVASLLKDVASLVKDVASGVKNLKLKPSLCDDDGDSKKMKQFEDKSQKDDNNGRLNNHVFDKSSVTGESAVKDVASDVKNLNLKLCLCDDDGDSKKIKQFEDKSQKDDDNGRLNHHVFDKSSVTGADSVNNLKMSGYNRQGNRSASGKSDSRIKRTERKPNAKIDGSLDSSCSQNVKSSVIGESVVKDMESELENLKLEPILFGDDDDYYKKMKQFGDKSQKDDDNERIHHHVFDICPKRDGSAIKPKAPLHVKNKERRNQMKQSTNGQNIKILRSGMVLMKRYISSDDQISIVKTCRDLGISDGGFYQPGYSNGKKLHLKMMCLGKNWDPDTHAYTELRPFDNSKPRGIPENFHDLVKKAIQDSNEFIRGNVGSSDERKVIPSMSPDICIVKFYTKSGSLGLHQDKDESDTSLKKGLPVVSFSIGESAEFLYGETRSVDEADKVILESGDVLIYGGKSRLIYHGVTSICPDTAPTSLMEATDMLPGRLNITFRMF